MSNNRGRASIEKKGGYPSAKPVSQLPKVPKGPAPARNPLGLLAVRTVGNLPLLPPPATTNGSQENALRYERQVPANWRLAGPCRSCCGGLLPPLL